MKFTAIYIEEDGRYIGFVEELSGANTQGKTLEEVRENLKEAVKMTLEANRELVRQSIEGNAVLREPLELSDE